MSYRRRSYLDNNWSQSTTKVTVSWSSKSSAYSVNFSNTKHWNEMQVLINFIKNLNVGEKDCQMDDSSGKKVWTWYFVEQYLEPFKALVDSFAGANIFEWEHIPKPTGNSNTSIFVPNDVYLERFKTLTGQDITGLEFKAARSIYRRWMMQNHPDKGGDHFIVRDVNECWSNLEIKYFAGKKEQEYASI
jgi:hypothetical protein